MPSRKVMRLGSSSLVISLPKDWVENFKIKKGDNLEIDITSEGSLILTPKPKAEADRVAEILVSKDYSNGLLTRKLIAAYLSNYDTIKITSDDEFTKEQQLEVRNKLGKLTGCQIVESSLKQIIIHNLLKINSFEVNKGIYRAYLITISMFKDMMKAIDNQREELLDGIIEIDDDVDQFYFIILKQLRSVLKDFRIMRKLNLTPTECLDYFMVMQRIEHIADHVVNISKKLKFLMGKTQEFNQQIINELLKQVYEIYKGSMEAFLIGNVELANNMINKNDVVKSKKEKILQSLKIENFNKNQVAAITSIDESLFRISDYATDIAEVAINRSIT